MDDVVGSVAVVGEEFGEEFEGVEQVGGAKQTPLPFPQIFVQPTQRTRTLLTDVDFD